MEILAMPGTKKYRPSLTPTQISNIIELCKHQEPISPEAFSIIAVLAPFYTKISLGGVTASHNTKQARAKTPSELLDSLGGFDGIDNHAGSGTNLGLSNPHYWAECYDKSLNPDAKLTAKELEGCNEHRYLNDMMSAEEVKAFETGSGIVTSTGANTNPIGEL